MFDDLLGNLAGDVSLSYDPNSGLSAGLNAQAGGVQYVSAPPPPMPSNSGLAGISPTTLGIIAGAVLIFILIK